jgi:cytoskeletal protein CcmA (bactofilin family)
MKNMTKFLIFASLLLALLALPSQVNAQSPTEVVTSDDGGKVVFGSTYILHSGETLNGDLAIFGGSATIEQDASVEGDIAVFGGTLSVSGHVSGNINAMGGSVNLNETAVVEGNVQTMGVVVNQIEGALVQGNVIAEDAESLNLPQISPWKWFTNTATPAFGGAFRSIGTMMWAVLRALALGLIALLITLLAPRPTNRVTHAITSAPGVSAGIGLLTFVVAPALILILAITIILIPFSLLGIAVIVAAGLFALTAVGLELGNRLAGLFKVQWAEPVAAGIGAAFLSLLISLISLLPCIDWILAMAALAFGLGGIVLTRFGTQNYPILPAAVRSTAMAPVHSEAAPAPTGIPVIPEEKPIEPPGQDENPEA